MGSERQIQNSSVKSVLVVNRTGYFKDTVYEQIIGTLQMYDIIPEYKSKNELMYHKDGIKYRIVFRQDSTGDCCKIRGLHPDYFLSTNWDVTDYLKSIGAIDLNTVSTLCHLIISDFSKEGGALKE